MANFWEAWDLTKVHEGGYSNNPNDTGGETYRGISRKYNPSWNGWQLLDTLTPTTNFTNTTLDNLAATYYKSIYWGATLGELIHSQQLANVIFDSAVIAGVGRTNDFIKDILNKHFKGNFLLNGKTDINLINALNAVNADKFIKRFNLYRKKFFLFSAGALSKFDTLYNFFYKYNKTTEAKKAKNKIFLAGWQKRVNKYGTAQQDNTKLIAGVTLAALLFAYVKR